MQSPVRHSTTLVMGLEAPMITKDKIMDMEGVHSSVHTKAREGLLTRCVARGV